MKRNPLLAVALSAGALTLVAQSAFAGVTLRQGHKESMWSGEKHSITKLEGDTTRKQQGHYSNNAGKWDTIHETIDTGLGTKTIETQIEAISSSSGEMQEVSNEWLGFEERSTLHGYDKSSESYSGWDY